MGAEQSNHNLDLIEQQATSVILSFRAAEGSLEKEACLNKLKFLSNEAVKLKHAKRKKVDSTIACIEDYIREIAGSRRDSTFIESTSFVALPTTKRTTNTTPVPTPTPKPNNSSLQDITGRVQTLKQEIKTAVNNNDSKTLRTLERTIKILTEDLQSLPTTEESEPVQRQLTTLYNTVTKAKQEMRKEHERTSSIKGTKKKEFDNLEAAVDDQNIMLQTALKTDNQLLLKHVFDKIEDFRDKLQPLSAGLRKQRLQTKIEEMSRKTNERLEKYTVANRLSEHERDFQTIITKTDPNEIIKHLENLKKHIEDIPDSYEEILIRKKKLLQDLNQHLTKINNETVVLRNPINFDSVKTFNDFIESWEKTKDILQAPKTAEEAKHLYLLLNKLETSIRETKLELQNKFSFRKSQVSFHNDTSSIRSYTNPDLLKTKAKIYNIPIADIKQVNNAVVKTQTEKKVEALNDIRVIQSKVNFLKDKMSSDPKNDGYRVKLQNYYDKLTDYIGWDNENVSYKARVLRDQIQEILTVAHRQSTSKKEHNNSMGRRISVEASLDRIVAIQSSVNAIEKDILKDLDKPENLVGHKEKLLFNQNKLNSIVVGPQYEMIRQSKDSAMEKIKYCLNIINQKTAQQDKHDKENILKEELNKLKEQVGRFAGGYKNVLYNDIETKLNKLLVQASEAVNDEEFVAEIEKSLKILEQRSTKTQSFRASIRPSTLNRKEMDAEIEMKLTSINESLSGIKRDIRIEDPMSLSGRLNLLKIEADQLYLRASENLKSNITDLLDDIDGCANFVSNRINTEYSEMEQFDERMASGFLETPNEISTVRRSSKINEASTSGVKGSSNVSETAVVKSTAGVKVSEAAGIKEPNKIEKKLDEVISKIEKFIGLEESEEYERLDDELLTLTLDADKLPRSDRKTKIIQQIDKYDKNLQERAKQCKELSKIEHDIETIKQLKPNLSNKNEVEDLDEELTALQIRITKLELDKILDERKTKCFEFVKGYLQEIRALENLDVHGTLV